MLRCFFLLAVLTSTLFASACVRDEPVTETATAPRSGGFSGFFDMLEPPGHAPGEPHPFDGCPEGACPRDEPAYLFSGEFHETVVDLRVSSCTVGLDLVWARRYRSRAALPSSLTPMGNGWDHSYNIFIEVASVFTGGPPVVVYDGNARPAIFEDDGNGSYTAPKYHRVGEFDEDNRFVLTFADGGQWIFRSPMESAQSEIRKLWKIVDRNGNEVELEYDSTDRLERVINAVGQSLELAYDTSGHISSVTAQLDLSTQRTVTYEHYGASDPDGNEGDLQSATLPPITGTVTSNNFPSGTTTAYTYSIGSSEAELNGNLLTIEDALGQVYLTNTYASTTNPAHFEFDRLVVQAWGDTSDLIGITYAPETPSVNNAWASTKAWMNDRVGRVSEHFFDDENQLVMVREYTGVADPDLPTDDTNNQPTGKLRSGDPTDFEKRFAYNTDGHVTFELHPRGNGTEYVYEGDLNPTASPLVTGNLRERHRYGQICDSGFPTITELFEYEPGRGNEHGSMNFVTLATDPLANETGAEYDAAGNRIAVIHAEPDTREDMEYSSVGQLTLHIFPEDQHGLRREIEYTYANDGRLREKIEDPEGLELVTTREYDVACNETRRIDALGYDTLYTYNAHNELIREEGPLQTYTAACGGGSAWRDDTDRIYDANMNLVRVDYEALDCDGTPQANAVVSTTFEYDILNELTVTRSEIASGVEVVEELQLDANREVVVLLQGEAVAANDPFNTVTTVYDERGLTFREIRGDGSASESTTQHDYDLNGNETVLLDGLEGPTRTTTNTFDCADRLTATVDPLGNRTEYDYDLGSNVEEQRFYGELVDVPGSTGNVLIARSTMVYDAMNRVTETTRDHFDPATQTAIGDGESVTTVVYDGESRIVSETDDLGHQTFLDFDAVGRRSQTIDKEGNIEDQTFDAVGNVLTRTLTDVSSLGGAPQVGVWTHIYDAEGNLVEVEDPVGSTRHNCYDSLGRLVEEIDPRGNHTLHTYDGAGRLLETTHELTDDGTGSGTLVGAAVTSQTWDDSNRLLSREDPNGNLTEYEYDSLDRLTTETFADSTETTFSYDVHGNLLVQEDPNGTILTMTYDALDRRIEVDVDPGPTVVGGTSLETYAYEARSLLVTAIDDDSEVARTYDSLAALLSETQTYDPNPMVLPPPAYTITYTRDGVGNAVSTLYPSGRDIDRTFDGLRRTTAIEEGSTSLVEIEYLGPNVQRRTYLPPQLVSEYTYDAARRMTANYHDVIAGATLDEREYFYDASGNKTSAEDLGPGTLAGLHVTEHDSLDRTVDSQVTGSAVTNRTVAYAFDGAGNRTSVSGGACAGTYAQTGSDALMHQYTETPCEDWSHDDGGNLVLTDSTATGGRELILEIDHRDRVVDVLLNLGTSREVHLRFAYDALGRKIHTTRTTTATIVEEQFIYDDWNVIEEYQNGAGTPIRTYLYGDGLDDRLQMIGAQPWWFFDDELGSTTAVVYRNGGGSTFVEKYAYQDYGAPRLFYQGSPTFTSVSGNPYLFAGARWLRDVGLYDMRTRHFDTLAGRFTSRDSIGIWGDEENLGNGYTYVNNGPESYADPTGEEKPHLSNCASGRREKIEDALAEANEMAKEARDWFNRRADRKYTERKKEWKEGKLSSGADHPGPEWWGGYNNTRFHRIKWNFRKIRTRISKNVITFRCRSSGLYCGTQKKGAWTLSAWHAWIRLCRNDGRGFFTQCGELRDGVRRAGALIVHEVSHNINTIGDKKLNGKKMNNAARAKELAGAKPTRASWNAANYQHFARRFRP